MKEYQVNYERGAGINPKKGVLQYATYQNGVLISSRSDGSSDLGWNLRHLPLKEEDLEKFIPEMNKRFEACCHLEKNLPDENYWVDDFGWKHLTPEGRAVWYREIEKIWAETPFYNLNF